MALPSLASLTDVEDRLGRDLDAAESRRASALLSDASTVARNYCRRDFTAGSTTARYRPRGRKVVLSQRPVVSVTSVSSVLSIGTATTITPLSFWSWPGGNEILLGDPTLVINGPTFEWSDSDVWVQVAYTHGFTTVPEDVLAVVANMVVRALTAPKGGLVDTEQIGPYNVRYSGFATQGPLGLAEPDRQTLNRYRSVTTHTVELRG